MHNKVVNVDYELNKQYYIVIKQEIDEENQLMYCVLVDEEIIECVENTEPRSFDHINLYISKGSGSGSASGKIILSDMSVKSL